MMNDHGEFTEFENRLVKMIADNTTRHYHLSHTEREDLTQELYIVILNKRCKYDSDHPSGATYEAYLTNYLKICSSRVVAKVRFGTVDDVSYSDASSRYARNLPPTDNPENLIVLNDIVENALKSLTPLQKEIFNRRYEGDTIVKIARDMKLSPMQARYLMMKIREVFIQNGLTPTSKTEMEVM